MAVFHFCNTESLKASSVEDVFCLVRHLYAAMIADKMCHDHTESAINVTRAKINDMGPVFKD